MKSRLRETPLAVAAVYEHEVVLYLTPDSRRSEVTVVRNDEMVCSNASKLGRRGRPEKAA